MDNGNGTNGQARRIDQLYAWVATEANGGEGIVGHEMILDGRLMFSPLVGADLERIESYRQHARSVAQATGYTVRLVAFTTRQVLDEKP